MIIIDNKRTDYYDGVMKVAADREVRYIRTAKEIEIKKDNREYKDFRCLIWNSNYRFDFRVIGFCGKIFPVIYCQFLSNTYSEPKQSDVVFYSFESIEKYVQNGLIKVSAYEMNNFRELFTKYKVPQNFLSDIFINNKCPIFVVRDNTQWGLGNIVIEINPMLKNYDFATIYPPYQAYQEVFQYISNFAEDRKQIPEIDNDDKILTHGFNKFSFRKEKSTRRK